MAKKAIIIILVIIAVVLALALLGARGKNRQARKVAPLPSVPSQVQQERWEPRPAVQPSPNPQPEPPLQGYISKEAEPGIDAADIAELEALIAGFGRALEIDQDDIKASDLDDKGVGF